MKISPIKISMLRQWLNEDRIDDPKKMITNSDIEYWLGIIDRETFRKQQKKENSAMNKAINNIRTGLIKFK
jgi:hypothetical protein